MNKYLSVLKFNLKTELNFKIDYIFSILSFAVHIFIFNELWDFILKDKAILGFTKPELIWYIIVGEFIAYSIGKKNYLTVSEMIKNGDVANLLTKPISFIKYILAEEGTCIVNIIVNAVFGILLGLFMAGPINVAPLQLILFIVSISVSLIIAVLLQVFIGLLAFITEENHSFYMVISKAMLILIFTPLEFFPKIVQVILKFLPTTYIVYPSASILTNFNISRLPFLLIGQMVALGVIILGVLILNRKGVKNINVNGG